MSEATVSVFIDKYHPRTDGNCMVTIRITHQRVKRYYPTGISLKAEHFEKIMTAQRHNKADKEIYDKIHAFESKASDVKKSLTIFTFGKFEDIYLENRDATDSVSLAFTKYAEELRIEKRIGTAVSCECAKASLESFKKGLKFADITVSLLKKYQSWMLDNEKSITTVGIYLRSLRTIYNRAKIDHSLYPFGNEKDKYSIPTGKNIKKALSLDEIKKIFQYKIQKGTTSEMARDYWIFIYLCNGLNVKDLCLLKHKNIKGDILKYERAKTKRTAKESEEITVSLKPEAKTIINKWGQKSINPDSYIFPHLHKGMTAENERRAIQQLTKTINKYMKLIATSLKINKEVTTYFARHSFATVLKNSGVSVEFISEALGHKDMKTTRSYLAGFEDKQIHETTNVLTAFAKKTRLVKLKA